MRHNEHPLYPLILQTRQGDDLDTIGAGVSHLPAGQNNEQIIDDRYNRKATIMCSQLPVTDWYNVFQSELIAKACLDRIVHKAIKIELKGESLREKY